jgi:glycogen operon protein
MDPEQTRPITAIWPGQPYPRGATWDGEGVNFSIFSTNAEKVELCIFDPSGRHEVQRIALRERTDEIWHSYLPEARPGLLYGYRVHGPYDPEKGHRFNANKLLIEPYAKHLQGNMVWSDAHFGTTRPICHSTSATARRVHRSAGSSIPPSHGVMTGPRECRGMTQSFTRRTSAD